ncbi:MAG: hypothetical protein HYU05_01875 [Candidatus Wildermuthbacteria bacterium]|nr:hypothetical protein [Candidatus Wildermuthbacteria bacterium]
MPKKQALTVVELKALLLARFSMEESKRVKLQARLQQELGKEVQEEGPEVIAIKNRFADWISDVLARRLKRNRRTTPLLSFRDFVRFAPSMISEIEGDKLDAESRKMFERFMKVIFSRISEMVHAVVPSRENPYEEYWRWATTVLDLAAERGSLPTELLALESMTDEITRRMFTKKQFVTLSKEATNKFVDVDMFKKVILQPMLDMATEGDEKYRRELEQELEAELMPQLRETIEKFKVVINSWLDEEVERIYAAM